MAIAFWVSGFAWTHRTANYCGIRHRKGRILFRACRAMSWWLPVEKTSGPTSWHSDIYGISLATGELLWTADDLEPDGLIGWFFYKLGLYRETDSPKYVSENQVHCTSGRILDVRTGELLIVPNPEQEPFRSDAEAHALYSGNRIAIDTEEGLYLSVKPMDRAKGHRVPKDKNADDSWRSWGVNIYGVSDANPDGWRFELREYGYSSNNNYYGYRYNAPYVYMLGKEGDYYDEPKEGDPLKNRDASFHLIVLDARTGEVAKDILLPEQVHEYRIESISSRGILLSHSNKYLALHPFAT